MESNHYAVKRLKIWSLQSTPVNIKCAQFIISHEKTKKETQIKLPDNHSDDDDDDDDDDDRLMK